MKLYQDDVRSFIIIVMMCLLFPFHANAQHGIVQDDPVLAPKAVVAPTIDGRGDDACWQNVPWQGMMQVWIDYGTTVDSSDYYGRYKVVWSSTTNLLYFLMEVHDDVFVDGYKPTGGGAIYDYDISEVFIDENASGGEHRYDGPATNAENAFAYHMYAACPADGQVTTAWQVDDMAGTQQASARANYTSHFPEYALRRTGQTAVREFSLIVYNDTYTESNKAAARSQLAAGKEMGISVAYCDNDGLNENPKVRDHMFGSVWEAAPGNMHWMNADGFGHVTLAAETSTGVANRQPISAHVMKLYPNPSSSSSKVELENSYRGEVSIRLYNLLGQEISRTSASKLNNQFAATLQLQKLPPGMYFIQMNMGHTVYSEKLLVTSRK
ncbi:MAG: T9SS C-terminal target domain-containing protein [Ignavibacteriae bacterium]|nr:MAG: T9SS C-terminal target domain-containing protein [Ignavibacteriota bacterium]